MKTIFGGRILRPRRCKRCKTPDPEIGLDCYVCSKCGVMPAGLWNDDPTEVDVEREQKREADG